jgi:hypothetical protein
MHSPGARLMCVGLFWQAGMDRKTLLRYLQRAERNFIDGRDRIAAQETLIAKLDQEGDDTTDARKHLEVLRATQTLHRQNRDRILKELQDL